MALLNISGHTIESYYTFEEDDTHYAYYIETIDCRTLF